MKGAPVLLGLLLLLVAATNVNAQVRVPGDDDFVEPPRRRVPEPRQPLYVHPDFPPERHPGIEVQPGSDSGEGNRRRRGGDFNRRGFDRENQQSVQRGPRDHLTDLFKPGQWIWFTETDTGYSVRIAENTEGITADEQWKRIRQAYQRLQDEGGFEARKAYDALLPKQFHEVVSVSPTHLHVRDDKEETFLRLSSISIVRRPLAKASARRGEGEDNHGDQGEDRDDTTEDRSDSDAEGESR